MLIGVNDNTINHWKMKMRKANDKATIYHPDEKFFYQEKQKKSAKGWKEVGKSHTWPVETFAR